MQRKPAPSPHSFSPEPPEDPALVQRIGLRDLLYRADRLRQRHAGNRIRTCAAINAKSGNCSQDCAFCAQSAHNLARTPVHDLLPRKELIQRTLAAAEAGASNVSLVSSGRSLAPLELERICEAVEEIRSRVRVSVCASLGTLTPETAAQLSRAGVSTYHHNLETAPSHYPWICSTHAQEERVRTVRTARQAGMRVCCGGIFGLGETWPQRLELAQTLRALEADSIPVNFLHPIPGTPLEDRAPPAPLEALRCVALLRLINPDRDIVICGGRESALRSLQPLGFPAGANGLMVGDYLTTRGAAASADFDMLRDCGLESL